MEAIRNKPLNQNNRPMDPSWPCLHVHVLGTSLCLDGTSTQQDAVHGFDPANVMLTLFHFATASDRNLDSEAISNRKCSVHVGCGAFLFRSSCSSRSTRAVLPRFVSSFLAIRRGQFCSYHYVLTTRTKLPVGIDSARV